MVMGQAKLSTDWLIGYNLSLKSDCLRVCDLWTANGWGPLGFIVSDFGWWVYPKAGFFSLTINKIKSK